MARPAGAANAWSLGGAELRWYANAQRGSVEPDGEGLSRCKSGPRPVPSKLAARGLVGPKLKCPKAGAPLGADAHLALAGASNKCRFAGPTSPKPVSRS